MNAGQERGRSPSQGQRHHISPQPSPSQFHDALPQFGLDPAIGDQTFTTGRFNTASHFAPPPFLDPTAQAQEQQPQQLASEGAFYSNNQYNHGVFQDHSYMTQAMMFQNNHMAGEFQNNGYPLDDTFTANQNVDPANLSKVSSPRDHQSPSLLSPENHSSPGQPLSPSSTQGQYYTPQHSRQASLDPSSAQYPQGDWQGMNFQNHRRSHSDVSDLSSNSASPYLGQQELFPAEDNRSPFLNAQQDGGSTYGMDGFSLAEQPHHSAGGHPAYISPRLMPAQNQGLGIGQDPLGQNRGGSEIYPDDADEPYPSMAQLHARNGSTISDMGQADQFAPPTINIEPAPVSRQPSFGPDPQDLGNGLSPLGNRGRGRSKSDLTSNRGAFTRSASPSVRSPGHRHSDSLSVRSPSPSAVSFSREVSPSGSSRADKNRRASTPSMNTRDYILDLADPSRPNASPASHSSTRVQKHPANFQCHMCPKKFTRAYNLRSHLRTHTDERPFVCSVCQKAFARQHDRKRHEGLHTGEKKFACRGELHSRPGQTWGCGRKFARADALGRHFRSEAGRVCIKPLLDEEAEERRRGLLAAQHHQQQQQHQQQQELAFASSQHQQQDMYSQQAQGLMMGIDPATGTGGFALPAALLAQYPQLGNIDWNAISQGGLGEGDDDGELSDVGPSATAGGPADYDFDDGINDAYNPAGVGGPSHVMGAGAPGMAGAFGQHGQSSWQ